MGGDERRRLVGQPRRHKKAVETQEHTEEQPRENDQHDAKLAEQASGTGHPRVHRGKSQEDRNSAHHAECAYRHPRAVLRESAGSWLAVITDLATMWTMKATAPIERLSPLIRKSRAVVISLPCEIKPIFRENELMTCECGLQKVHAVTNER